MAITIRTKPVSLAVQGQSLVAKFSGRFSIDRAEMQWNGILSPTSLSPAYKVKVSISHAKPPQVRVLSPALEPIHGPVPHLYKDGNLCLFYPKAKEWDSSQLISRTIVPWAIEWLFHYEIWKITGQWNGGGIEHEAA